MSDFEFSYSKPSQATAVRRNKDKLRVLVLGNFCGSQKSIQPLEARTPLSIDIDNFEQVLSKMAPVAEIACENQLESIQVTSLADFSPDALLTNTPSLSELRTQRASIKAGNVPTDIQASSQAKTKDNPEPSGESTDDTVNRLLGGKTDTGKVKPAGGLLDNFIKQVVSADQVAPSANVDAHLSGCDSAISARMREVLHAPALAHMEASWRGLCELIHTVEDDEQVDVAVLHATAEELTNDLCRGDNELSALVTTLVEEAAGTFGGQGWDWLVVSDPLSIQDANLVAALGALSKAAGGKLLANMPASEFAHEPPNGWHAFRAFDAADAIHLITPLVLVRPPYGSQHDAPDTFEFEECTAAPAAEDLVWGSSALVVASCLVQAHQGNGGRGNLSDQTAAQFRPQFTFDKDGVKTMQPVAEQLFSDSQAEALRAQWGVMPIRAELNGNRLLFVAPQSLHAK